MKKLLAVIIVGILLAIMPVSSIASSGLFYQFKEIEVNQDLGFVTIRLNNVQASFSEGIEYEFMQVLDWQFNDENSGVQIVQRTETIYHTEWHPLGDELSIYAWLRDTEAWSNFQALIPGQEHQINIIVNEYSGVTLVNSGVQPVVTLPDQDLGTLTENVTFGEPEISGTIEYNYYSDSSGNVFVKVLSNSVYDVSYVLNTNRGDSPQIELVGDDYIELYVGETYTDSGVTITHYGNNVASGLVREVEVDIYDWSINSGVDEIDTSKQGYYQIVYELVDDFGSKSREYRTVNVYHNPTEPVIEGELNDSGMDIIVTGADITSGFLNIHYDITGTISNTNKSKIQFNFSIEGNDTWPWINAENDVINSSGVVSFNLDNIILDPNVPAISTVSSGLIGAYIWEYDATWQHKGSLSINEFTIPVVETSYSVGALTYTLMNDEFGALAIKVENSANNPSAKYIWDLQHYSNGSLADNFLDVTVEKVTVNRDLGTIDIEYSQTNDITESGSMEMNLYTHFQANGKSSDQNEWLYIADRGDFQTSGVFSLPLKNAVQSQNMSSVFNTVTDWDSEQIPNGGPIGFNLSNYNNTDYYWENLGYYSINALLYSSDVYLLDSGVTTVASGLTDFQYQVGSLTYTLDIDSNGILNLFVENSNYVADDKFDHSIRNDFDWLDFDTFEFTAIRIVEDTLEIDYLFNIDESIDLDEGSYNLNVYTEQEECFDNECMHISLWGYNYLGEVSTTSGLNATSGTLVMRMSESNLTSWYQYNLEAIKDRLATDIKVDLSYWNSETSDYGYASFKPEIKSGILDISVNYELKPYETDDRVVTFTWSKDAEGLLELSWVNGFYDSEATLYVPTPEEVNIVSVKLTEKTVDKRDPSKTESEIDEVFTYYTILVELEERLSGGLKLNTDPDDYESWVGYAEGKYGEVNYYQLFYGDEPIVDQFLYLEHWGNDGVREYIPLMYSGADVVFKNNAYQEFSPMMPMKEQLIKIYGDENGFLRITAEEIVSKASVITSSGSFDINLTWQRLGDFGNFTMADDTGSGTETMYMYGNFGTIIEISDDAGETWEVIDEFNFYDAEFSDSGLREAYIQEYMQSTYKITDENTSGISILPNSSYIVRVRVSSDYRNDSTDDRLANDDPDSINFSGIMEVILVTYEEIVLLETVTTGAFLTDIVVVDTVTEVIIKADGTVAIVTKTAEVEISTEEIPSQEEEMDNSTVNQADEQNSSMSNSALTGATSEEDSASNDEVTIPGQ